MEDKKSKVQKLLEIKEEEENNLVKKSNSAIRKSLQELNERADKLVQLELEKKKRFQTMKILKDESELA